MSEKPFWEGKTCEEMAGLHVKATWKNGTIPQHDCHHENRRKTMMCFHRISPCPKCGGKVKAKWEEQHYLSALVFRCGGCRYKPYALALKSKPAVEWEWPKDMMLAAAIRRWNAMCNGDKRYRLIYESLGGRR